MLGQIVEDRYLVEAELGAGAMGRVYRARHIRLGNHVAIKVMHRELLAVPSIVARFEREARLAARLNHSNVAGVFDVGQTADGRHLMVLELAGGRRLADYVTAPLERRLVVDVTRQLLAGLDHAHRMGLIHRDLKPDNILVETTRESNLRARIVDFGIAVLRDSAEDRLTQANTIVGTPHYMSPEHATGREIDARTDLFALGVIVYEMLAGRLPFQGTGAEIARANVTRDPPPITMPVDPLLEAFARKLMARRLERRFQSAREALDALALIERDRIAAARMLCDQPPPPPALPIDSDTLPTARLTALTAELTAELLAPGRRRAWISLAATAVAVALAIAWA